jgi:hypothetical protein
MVAVWRGVAAFCGVSNDDRGLLSDAEIEGRGIDLFKLKMSSFANALPPHRS